MSSDLTDNTPYFQQLQKQFAEHIRNPENTTYAPVNEAPIESRRLEAYQALFFNNLEGFFSQMFPVCAEVLGSERWLQIIREYMVKHDSKTPLFHELGEEFLAFLEAEFSPVESDPAFLLELAHYEWVELALSVSTEEGFDALDEGSRHANHVIDLNLKYQLSPLAWPLAYEWPVHQLSKDFQPTEKPQNVTTLLVYRHLNEQHEEVIDFIALTPLLYQWLMVIDETDSARDAFEQVTGPYQLTPDLLEDVLQDLLDLNILKPVA